MTAVVIDRHATVVTGQVDSLKADFAERACLVFDDVFEPTLLDWLMDKADGATFVDDDVRGLGTRAIESPQRVGSALSVMLERRNWLDWLEAVTGIAPLRAMAGRLTQHRANGTDQLDWHDDRTDPSRQLAVVINLSSNRFDGGLFEMRRVGEACPYFAFQHRKAGSLMVFAVRPDLQHRVRPVTSGGPRRTFAGWLLSEPEKASTIVPAQNRKGI